LQNDQVVSIDMRSAARYFKLVADQGLAEAEYHYALCLLAGVDLQRDRASAIQYVKISAAKGSPIGEYVVGWMAANRIGGLRTFFSSLTGQLDERRLVLAERERTANRCHDGSSFFQEGGRFERWMRCEQLWLLPRVRKRG
jgi:hypothetical protein